MHLNLSVLVFSAYLSSLCLGFGTSASPDDVFPLLSSTFKINGIILTVYHGKMLPEKSMAGRGTDNEQPKPAKIAYPMTASKATFIYPREVEINKVVYKFPSSPGLYELVGRRLRAVGVSSPGYYRVIQFGHDFTFLNRFGEEFSMTIPNLISVKDSPGIALEEEEYFRNRLIQLPDEYDRHVGKLQKGHGDLIEKIEVNHRTRTNDITKDHNDLINGLQNGISKFQQQYSSAMKSLPTEALTKENEQKVYETRMAKTQDVHKKFKEEAVIKYGVLLKKQEDDHKLLVGKLWKAHEDSMEKQWDDYAKRMREVRMSHSWTMGHWVKHRMAIQHV